MSDVYRQYIDLFDELRRAREEFADDEAACELAERAIDDELDALWERLSDDEQASTREESWRAWPDEYASRMMPVHDISVWSTKGTVAPRESARVV
jgi:hypothetical protein